MKKYLTLLGTSLIICLTLFIVSTRNVSATDITTGLACSDATVINVVNSNDPSILNYQIIKDWFNINCHFACNSDHMCVVAEGEGTNQCSTDSDCQTPPPTCPTDCGQPASRISDGKGGYISCDATAACPVSVPTEAPSTNPGGPGDGLGCATHDCSGNKVGGGSSTQAVLGASTGPQVLGLSTTSGEESFLPQWLQLFGALTSGGLGLIFFKKNG